MYSRDSPYWHFNYINKGAQRFPDYTEEDSRVSWKDKTSWRGKLIYLLDSSGFFSSYTCANAEGFILSKLFKCSDHKTQVQYKPQFFHLLNQMRLVGGWSLSQLSYGEKQVTPWTNRQLITRLTKREKQTNIFTNLHSNSQFRVTS